MVLIRDEETSTTSASLTGGEMKSRPYLGDVHSRLAQPQWVVLARPHLEEDQSDWLLALFGRSINFSAAVPEKGTLTLPNTFLCLTDRWVDWIRQPVLNK